MNNTTAGKSPEDYQLVVCTKDGCEKGWLLNRDNYGTHGEPHDLCKGTGLRGFGD